MEAVLISSSFLLLIPSFVCLGKLGGAAHDISCTLWGSNFFRRLSTVGFGGFILLMDGLISAFSPDFKSRNGYLFMATKVLLINLLRQNGCDDLQKEFYV